MSTATCCRCLCRADQKLTDELKISTLYQFCGNRLATPTISGKLCAFRVFAAAYSLFIVIWNLGRFINIGIGKYWPIFFTQWIAVLTTVYFICISILHFKLYRRIQSSPASTSTSSSSEPTTGSTSELGSNSSPSNLTNQNDIVAEYRYLAKTCNILWPSIAAPSILVTLMNWTVITDYSNYLDGDSGDVPKVANDIHIHGMQTLLVLIEYTLSLSYLRYADMINCIGVGALFVFWSVIHYAANFTSPGRTRKRYIYPLLNWEYPTSALIVCAGLLIGVILFHYLLSYIKYKCLLAKWVKSERGKAEQHMTYGIALANGLQNVDSNKSDDEKQDDAQDMNGVHKPSKQKSATTLSFEKVNDDEMEISVEPNEVVVPVADIEHVNVHEEDEDEEDEAP